VENPDAVNFDSVGDEYRRSIRSLANINANALDDIRKRGVQDPEEVDFEAVGDEY